MILHIVITRKAAAHNARNPVGLPGFNARAAERQPKAFWIQGSGR